MRFFGMARQTRSMTRVRSKARRTSNDATRARKHKSASKPQQLNVCNGSQGATDGQDNTSHKKDLLLSARNAELADKKLASWSQHADSSPFPAFPRPTPEECHAAHRILSDMHGDAVQKNFEYDKEEGPVQGGKYTSVMDALVVAAVSQATSWANAKRAMNSMKQVYGSTFAYEDIVQGGLEKLTDALRPGGMQNRKAKILMGLLEDVKSRHGNWDLQYLFEASDSEVMKEVTSYWGLGPKCAYCLMSICLKRDKFAVDTHIYRLSGLWGWRPEDVSAEKTQAHLDARVPDGIKFMLHYEMITHGRECRSCRGQVKKKDFGCEFLAILDSWRGQRRISSNPAGL